MDCSRSARRRGFSLAELIVSIGILVLMFSLAGQVFNVTVQSTGQARAVTHVSQILRAVEETIREDLRHVQPGRSLILIQGNPVNAYWTKEGMDSDDDGDPSTGYAHVADPAREKKELDANGNPMLVEPRADVLMFFTAHKGVSYTDPGVTSNLQQVVYGHAKLGEYVPDPAKNPPFAFEPRPDAFPVDSASSGVTYPSLTQVSPVPAEGWHLARRGVLLLPTAGPQITGAAQYNPMLQGILDVQGYFSYEDRVLTPLPEFSWAPCWYLPWIFTFETPPHERSLLDPTPPARLADRLGHYFLPDCASFKVEWTLDPRCQFVDGRLDGAREVYWFDPGDPDDPLAALEAAIDAAEKEGDEELQANLTSLLEDKFPDPADNINSFSLRERFRGKTLLEEPEACNELAYELYRVKRPNMVVFGPKLEPVDDVDAKPEIVSDDIFPSAVRITIDVFDRERRLERPTRHVIVAQVGK